MNNTIIDDKELKSLVDNGIVDKGIYKVIVSIREKEMKYHVQRKLCRKDKD